MNMKDSKLLLENKIADQIKTLPKSGIRDFFELVNQMDDVISLGIGEPDFVTPWHIRESAIYSLEQGHTSYTSNLGLLSLRMEISRYLEKNYNLEYDPVSQCIITVGVSEALDLVIRALVNPGDEIIYHEPCYVSYASEIIMAHGVPKPVMTREENEFALNPEELAKAVTPKTKAIILNFPCNPTGASLTMEQLQRISEIAIENDLVVIADEIYSELTYDKQMPSIATLPGMKERTVFLHGFSKAYAMTGFRIGYACGPFEIIDAMMKIHQYSMLCTPIGAQEAAVEALKNGEREMRKMKSEYRDRRNFIVARLNEIGLPCLKPKGAFYVFPRIKDTGLTSMEFSSKLLKDQQVAVVPGTAFGESGEGFVRCAYAASMENLSLAMDKIQKFMNTL